MREEYGMVSGSILQNLEDAGCDQKTVDSFVELGRAGETVKQLKLLERHRKTLLEQLHKSEKQIDCLDYLAYQMKKKS